MRNYEQGLSDVLSDGVELAEELSAERAGVLLGTEAGLRSRFVGMSAPSCHFLEVVGSEMEKMLFRSRP